MINWQFWGNEWNVGCDQKYANAKTGSPIPGNQGFAIYNMVEVWIQRKDRTQQSSAMVSVLIPISSGCPWLSPVLSCFILFLQEAEAAFRTWKKSEIFRRRVVAILTEESRGLALNSDYRVIVKWLREHFPVEEKYRVLVHAHAGDGNLQDAASIEAVGAGANGVWSAIIPQAALSGHNSSLVFLDNMLKVGNEFICDDYWIHQAAECARRIYYLNFNTFHIPDDCPIWGGRAKQEVHRAFRTVGVDEWRPVRQKYFDEWGIVVFLGFAHQHFQLLYCFQFVSTLSNPCDGPQGRKLDSHRIKHVRCQVQCQVLLCSEMSSWWWFFHVFSIFSRFLFKKSRHGGDWQIGESLASEGLLRRSSRLVPWRCKGLA